MNSAPPEFPRHDPATAAFWDVRFDADFMPWDQGGVPRCLRDYAARNALPRKVLIPGCGAAHEARFLLEQNWDVTAIDFSASAVARAKRLLGPFQNHMREADFFGEALGCQRYDAIYERAFLCALPRRRWPEWAARIAQLIPPQGRLFGFFFFDTSEKGPPFGMAGGELVDLLSPHFDLIEDSAPTDSIAVFAGKERWQVWRRRA